MFYFLTHMSLRPPLLPLIRGKLPKQLSKVRRWFGGTRRAVKWTIVLFAPFSLNRGVFIDACWLEHPKTKNVFHSRGGGPPGAVIPLNNITISYLQAMISQAVDNVLASANKSRQFGRLCDSSPLSIHSIIPSTLATLSPFNLNDKASQFEPTFACISFFINFFQINKTK